MGVIVTNILDMVRSSGEDTIRKYLSAFSCIRTNNPKKVSLNPDIEYFLKENAIQFAKQKISVTYIVIDMNDASILGYFTIGQKILEITPENLSNTAKKKVQRYASYDKCDNVFKLPAYLIAQLGKNYSVENGKRLRGKDLIQYVEDILCTLQYYVGGGIVYLDCADREELIRFYESEHFKYIGYRLGEKNGVRYRQYMKFF